MKRFIFLSIAFIIQSQLFANADTIITSVSTSSFMSQEISSRSVMYLTENQLKVDVKGTNTNSTMIFDAQKNSYWIVDHITKSKMRITENDLQNLNHDISSIQKEMAQKIKQMSPDEKKMMQELMSSSGMNIITNPNAKIEFKKIKSNVTIEKWTTDKYMGTRDGVKDSEIWTVPRKNLNLKENDYELFKKLSKFTENVTQITNPLFLVGSKGWIETFGYEGLPIKVCIYANDKLVSTSKVENIEEKNLEKTVFQIPEEYQIINFELGKK